MSNLQIKWGGFTLAEFVDSVSGLALNGQRLEQTLSGVRAANAKPIDRRGSSNTMSFTVTRFPNTSLTDALAAIFYVGSQLDASSADPRSLVINLGPTVDTARQWSLANCVLMARRARHVGVTVIIDYELKGGLLSSP